jgi:hypothetical protein
VSRINERLDHLATLKQGWLGNDEGNPLNPAGVEWLKDILGSLVDTGELPRPSLYPTPEGHVLAEWYSDRWAVSAEFDLVDRSAELMAADLAPGSKDMVETFVRLETYFSADPFVDFVKKFMVQE